MHYGRKPLVFISPEYYARVVPRDFKTIVMMQNIFFFGGGGGGGVANKVFVGDA